MESSIPHLREILVFLAAAGILVPLFQRFKISPVLGFLIAGLILGPYGMGSLAEIWPPASAIVITESEGVHALGELGIVFLLFMIGLELSFERLSSMRRLIFGLGAIQVVTSALIIGFIARMFGNAPLPSLILGLALALSSTAIVMQLLSENRRLGSNVARASFSILIFQDLSVVILLFIVGFVGPDMAGGLSGSLVLYFSKALVFAALAITGIIIMGRLALRPLFSLAGKSKNKELFMAATLLAVFGIAAGTEMAGLSLALGAFLAGLLLAETEYRHDIEVTIEPFKGLLLGLFFMSIGMDVDLRTVLAEPFWIPASVIGLILLKAMIIYPTARVFGLSRGKALEVGLLLGQAGEFAFVVLAMATSMISRDTQQFMLIVTSLTMMITPLIAHIALKMRQYIDGQETSPYGPAGRIVDQIDGHVILAGYGRMGRLMRDVLAKRFIPVIAIDTNADMNNDPRTAVLNGDAADPDTLKKAGINRAIAVAVVIDEGDTAKRVVDTIRKLKPNMLIVARARDNEHASALYQLGAVVTIPDVIEGSLHLSQELMTHLGIPEEAARHTIDQQRLEEAHAVEQARNN